MTKGFVYFVACKDPNYRIANPHMKIGHTTNLEGRLSSIQTGSPVALMFMGYIESNEPQKLERYFHKTFQKDRKHGEWFDVTAPMIARICSYKVLENRFDEFFFKPEEIASKEIRLLKAEIEGLKKAIEAKDRFIQENGIECTPTDNYKRNREREWSKFRRSCIH